MQKTTTTAHEGIIGVFPLQRTDRSDGEDTVDSVKLDVFCPETEECLRIWRPGPNAGGGGETSSPGRINDTSQTEVMAKSDWLQRK